MSRARWKGPVSHKRSTSITPAHLGNTYNIHNGKSFIPLTITSDLIGHKLGEFVFTKKPAKYSK